MERMLSLTADRRREMGMAGRRKMEQEFAKDKVVAQTIRAVF
jgi:hypothetical protein